MNTTSPQVRLIDVPASSRINSLYATTHLADAFAVELPPGATQDAESLARFVIGEKPAWLRSLLWFRDTIMAPFGVQSSRDLRHAPGERIDFFRIYARHPEEIILGEDDRHLDFRVSVLVRQGLGAGRTELVMSTVVHCHNLLGRIYIMVIAPFHRLVVRSGLQMAVRRGWPAKVG